MPRCGILASGQVERVAVSYEYLAAERLWAIVVKSFLHMAVGSNSFMDYCRLRERKFGDWHWD